MRRSWSLDAGAPSVPAAFALAAGILASAVSTVPPRAIWIAALGVLLAGSFALGLLRRSGMLLAAVGLTVLLFAGYARGRAAWILPAARAERTARDLPANAIVEAVGRLDSFWAASGSLRRARLRVESATADGRALAVPYPIALVVGGDEDPARKAGVGDLVRVRGPLRLPDVVSSPRSPFLLPAQPRLFLKSAAQIESLGPPRGPLAPVLLVHRGLVNRLETNLAGAPPGSRRALALLLAVLFGETAELPGSVTTAFREGGVAHVLSISGLHVGFVAAILSWGLRGLSLRVATRDAILLAATALFAVFAGGRPPVLRAALMIGLYLAARLLGRPTSPAHVVGFAAAALLLADPSNLFDTGFLLTFTAVFGLAAFGAPVAAWLREKGLRPVAADSLGATLGAELAVFPVQSFAFNVVPFVAIVSNLVVVPVAGLFVAAGLASMPLLALSPETAAVGILPLRLLSDFLLAFLNGLDRAHAFRFVATPAFWLVALLAALLFAGGIASKRSVRRAALLPAFALAGAILASPAVLARPGSVSLQALDVGQGDAWLLVSSRGRLLVDGGGGIDPDYEFGRLRLLPKLGDLGAIRFDAVVLTHPHPDHARGLLGVLDLMPVGELVLPRSAPRNVFLDEVLDAAARRRVPIRRLGRGDRFCAAGLELAVLHPGPDTYPRSKENNGSLVLMTALEGRRLLLTGDIEAVAERDLLDGSASLSADVLKVPHHGSRTSTTPALLAAVSPRVALIGVGRRNGFGHPYPEVLGRLAASRIRVLRTDRDGDFGLEFTAGRIRPLFSPGAVGLAP